MPSITIRFPGTLPPSNAHPKATIKSAVGTTTLTITRPDVEHFNLAQEWVEVPRPGEVPLLRVAGGKLRKYRLEAILNAIGDGDIEADLRVLSQGHTFMPEVSVGFGNLEAGRFVITDMVVRSTRRQHGTNKIARAEVIIELTHKPDEPAQALPVSVPSASPPPSSPPPAAPAARTHTVRSGDTLWGIAIKFYNDGNRWRTIADANGVRDPRKLAIGTVLTIP